MDFKVVLEGRDDVVQRGQNGVVNNRYLTNLKRIKSVFQ